MASSSSSGSTSASGHAELAREHQHRGACQRRVLAQGGHAHTNRSTDRRKGSPGQRVPQGADEGPRKRRGRAPEHDVRNVEGTDDRTQDDTEKSSGCGEHLIGSGWIEAGSAPAKGGEGHHCLQAPQPTADTPLRLTPVSYTHLTLP